MGTVRGYGVRRRAGGEESGEKEQEKSKQRRGLYYRREKHSVMDASYAVDERSTVYWMPLMLLHMSSVYITFFDHTLSEAGS